MDLFSSDSSAVGRMETGGKSCLPLAARMRPQDIGEIVGQGHILAGDKLLPRLIAADNLSSLILYGPPGCGKTSLAYILGRATRAYFQPINAVSSSLRELRQVVSQAKLRRRAQGKKTVVFIDEIHRFNKAQQDALMPDLEQGEIVLIGATVENPSFYIIAPLLSRSPVWELRPLAVEEISRILRRAQQDKTRGLGETGITLSPEAEDFIARSCEGDARRALNALEAAAKGRQGAVITLKDAEQALQKKAVVYDKAGDGHYDTISAFIKSMRASDAQGALYWLAKMLCAGEDIRFIARRMVIFAAEDIGNADPQALVLANAAGQACERIGMPEARIILAQAAVYLSQARKDRGAYLAIEQAYEKIEKQPLRPVPPDLKNKQ
ncbi:MAG: replication-associated recombination protein A [Candidatus Omnitrophota bacterium]